MTGAARARPARVDLEAWRRDLHAADGAAYVAPAWLAGAAGDPAAFWRDAAPALLTAVAGSPRSSPFERYQLAHELGARHAAGRTPGFVSHDAAGDLAPTSYAALVAGATALAGEWRARGVEPGTCVAIVAPMSPELVTALLAAWHLGAVAAPVPLWGRTYVRHRLDRLEADFVATSQPRARWLELPDELRLDTRAVGGGAGAGAAPGVAHLYASDEAALRVFSPLGDAPLSPFDVPAERLYLGALRDGVVFFDLGAERVVAAPGFCEAQVGLPLLVTCLATGGGFLAIDLDEACGRPELVCDGRVHLLGVHPRLRDAIIERGIEGGVGGRGPARWFRTPALAHEPARWAQLAAARPFTRALGACYAPSPVAGGAITWSAWRRSPAQSTALPAPGLDWQLLDPGRGGERSADGAACAGGSGVLTSGEVPTAAIGRPFLGWLAGEHLWVTSLGAHRDGQRLPAGEIEALAKQRPEVWDAALVDDPRAGAVLVVFARPDRLAGGPSARDALVPVIAGLVEGELAAHLVPRIEVFTVSPRLDKRGALDRDWCRDQYVSGRLAARQREALFTMLATLRLALAD